MLAPFRQSWVRASRKQSRRRRFRRSFRRLGMAPRSYRPFTVGGIRRADPLRGRAMEIPGPEKPGRPAPGGGGATFLRREPAQWEKRGCPELYVGSAMADGKPR